MHWVDHSNQWTVPKIGEEERVGRVEWVETSVRGHL